MVPRRSHLYRPSSQENCQIETRLGVSNAEEGCHSGLLCWCHPVWEKTGALEAKVKEGFSALFETTLPSVEFQATRKDFEGDITIVVFPMLRYRKGNPAQIGENLGDFLVKNVHEVVAYNVVKGFLNLVIDDQVYLQSFNDIYSLDNFGFSSKSKDSGRI